MHLIGHSLIALVAFTHLRSGRLLGATLAAFAAVIAGAAIHEFGHWLPARHFGVIGRFKFFPNYGKSALGWVAVMGISLDEEKLSRPRYKVVVLGGVFFELLFALVCFFVGGHLPGPRWLGCGFVVGAAFSPIAAALNLVPIARLKNDGWKFLNPPM